MLPVECKGLLTPISIDIYKYSMVEPKNKNKKEKVLLTLIEVNSYNKIKAMLPDYKMSFSEFVDQMNVAFIDAVENNNGHFDLEITKPNNAINKRVEDIV